MAHGGVGKGEGVAAPLLVLEGEAGSALLAEGVAVPLLVLEGEAGSVLLAEGVAVPLLVLEGEAGSVLLAEGVAVPLLVLEGESVLLGEGEAAAMQVSDTSPLPPAPWYAPPFPATAYATIAAPLPM